MKIIYVDESGTFNDSFSVQEAKTNKRKSTHFVLSALIIDLENWSLVFERLKSLRTDLRHNYKISKSEQLHAHELISGSGVWRHKKYMHLTSPKRKKLLKYVLTNYSMWPEISIVTAVVDKLCVTYPSINSSSARSLAYENLFNRIEKTLGDERYIVINDGQEDFDVIKIIRKMKVFNPINGQNIALKSFAEDPLFKMSRNSYFLQLIDHIAYATLHLYDERLNLAIGNDLLNSNIYQSIGIKAVHRESANVLPGIINIPKISEVDLQALTKKSLGKSPDSSSGAGLTR